jgi:hypothetical protein
MPLAAYHPLEAVYKFHEAAETWILRRYLPQVVAQPGAERRRGAWSERVVDVFPERRPESTLQLEAGQQAAQRMTIYLRTQLRMTDTADPQPSDVLFAPDGTAWQVVEDGRWDESKGYAPVVQRAGRRGQRPWV